MDNPKNQIRIVFWFHEFDPTKYGKTSDLRTWKLRIIVNRKFFKDYKWFAYQSLNVKIFKLFILANMHFCLFHCILQILIEPICNVLYLPCKIKASQTIQYIAIFGKWQKIGVSLEPLNINITKKFFGEALQHLQAENHILHYQQKNYKSATPYFAHYILMHSYTL